MSIVVDLFVEGLARGLDPVHDTPRARVPVHRRYLEDRLRRAGLKRWAVSVPGG